MTEETPPFTFRFGTDPEAYRALVVQQLMEIRSSLEAVVSLVCELYEDPIAALAEFKQTKEDMRLRIAFELEQQNPLPSDPESSE